MAMKKYTSPEKVEVFYGEEAETVSRHLIRLGKAVSDFSPEELEDLQKDLEKTRESGLDNVSTTTLNEVRLDEESDEEDEEK